MAFDPGDRLNPDPYPQSSPSVEKIEKIPASFTPVILFFFPLSTIYLRKSSFIDSWANLVPVFQRPNRLKAPDCTGRIPYRNEQIFNWICRFYDYLSRIFIDCDSHNQSSTIGIPATYRSLFWMDENLGVEVYLLERQNNKIPFNLIVVSDKEVKVIYRTEINSMLPVVKELTPVRTVNGRNNYDVRHHFSRTTIWMSLDFKIDGKTVDSLSRYFYGKLIPDKDTLTKPPK